MVMEEGRDAVSGVVEWVQAREKVLLSHGSGPQPAFCLDAASCAWDSRVVPLGRFNFGAASSGSIVEGWSEVRVPGGENHDVVQAAASQVNEHQGAQDIETFLLSR